jgi:hypothetical protein
MDILEQNARYLRMGYDHPRIVGVLVSWFIFLFFLIVALVLAWLAVGPNVIVSGDRRAVLAFALIPFLIAAAVGLATEPVAYLFDWESGTLTITCRSLLGRTRFVSYLLADIVEVNTKREDIGDETDSIVHKVRLQLRTGKSVELAAYRNKYEATSIANSIAGFLGARTAMRALGNPFEPSELTEDERTGLGCLVGGVFVLFVLFGLPKSCASVPPAQPPLLTATPTGVPQTATRAAGTFAGTASAPTAAKRAIDRPVANVNANLRAGPGTRYAIVASAPAGQQLALVARNAAGDWLRLENGVWIFAALVTGAPDLPVDKEMPGLPLPTHTPRP